MRTNRRTFIKQVAVTGAAAAASGGARMVQAEAEIRPELKAFKERWQALPRQSGLKIKSIETFVQGTNLGLVRVRADDGSEGFGQLSPFDADVSALILHRKLVPLALGADPYDVDTLADRCIEANYKYPWSFVCRALCGLDTALWDLRGRREQKSVCQLLGGTAKTIPVYGSSMSRSIQPKAEAERLVRLRDEKGFRAFKIRVGKVCGHDQDEWPGRTGELVPTVRKAIGDKVALLVDGNSCYTPAKAIEVGRMLEQHRVWHFEEPCPYWELEWTAQVTAALVVPVAGGEQDNDLAQWRRMIRLRAVDIAQPDICYVGGITRAVRVAMMAAEAGLKCVPHSANLSLVTLFTAHLFGALPNAGAHMEFTIEKDGWTGGLYAPAFQVVDGRVAIPDGPGWGVAINPDLLAKAEKQTSQR
jgi:L-alanine-DL-glutamate epimerase-like enolase superfamily enzyme